MYPINYCTLIKGNKQTIDFEDVVIRLAVGFEHWMGNFVDQLDYGRFDQLTVNTAQVISSEMAQPGQI